MARKPPAILSPLLFVVPFALGMTAGSAVAAGNPSTTPEGVMAWKLPEQKDPAIRAVQDRLYRLIMMQARFALSQLHPWEDGPSLLLVSKSTSVELGIRPNTGTIEGLSFLHRHGPYDEKLIGFSKPDLMAKVIIPMMRYLTTTHVTGSRPTSDGRKWGQIKKETHEQSTYWASMLGRGAWWNWSELPEDLRGEIRRVVAYESDWLAANPPQFRLEYDTKSEENAWHCTVLDVALLIMPNEPRREKWEKTLRRYAISSYLRPADEHSSRLVDGRPISEQYEGANIFDDFTLENHGFVHPDYMSAFSLTLELISDFIITGRKPPEAMAYNAAEIYANLTWLAMPDGCCVFPNGEDWELFKAPDWLDVHTPAAVFLKDPQAWSNMLQALSTSEKMQAREPLGPVYAQPEYYYFGLQHELMYLMTREWMTLQVAGEIVDRPAPILGIKRWGWGKVIIHRTPTAVHTLSWGARVMAQCVPMQLDYIVSPDPENGVGYVVTEGGKHADPIRTPQARRAPLRDVKVSDTADGFTADLVVDHQGDAVRAELHFESKADGSLLMKEKLTALRDVTTTEIATGLIGILNNPIWVYQQGNRKITFDGKPQAVPPHSGKTFDGQGVRNIQVNELLEITSSAPLRAYYRGATAPDRGRATDQLFLNHISGRQEWKKRQVISEYEAVVRPKVTQ